MPVIFRLARFVEIQVFKMANFHSFSQKFLKIVQFHLHGPQKSTVVESLLFQIMKLDRMNVIMDHILINLFLAVVSYTQRKI